MEYEEWTRAVGACTDVMEELDAALRERWSRSKPAWPDLGFPCIDRGVHAVFPLLQAEVTADGGSGAERDLAEITEHLWRHWGYHYGGHDFRLGEFREDDAGGRKVLGDRLRSSGTRGKEPKWWEIANHVVIFLTSADEQGTSIRSAVHVVPKEWILAGRFAPSTDREASRTRRVARTVAAADLEWDWRPEGADPGALWATGRTDQPAWARTL